MTTPSRSSSRQPPVTVRPAIPADMAEAAQMWQAAWLDGHQGQVPAELLSARDEAYFSSRAHDLVDRTLLSTEPGGPISGIVIVVEDEIDQLAVADAARRRGVGAALLQAAEARIAGTHQQAWLDVVPGNVRARRFYQDHGWHDAGGFTKQVPAAAGPIAVPVRRYRKGVRR